MKKTAAILLSLMMLLSPAYAEQISDSVWGNSHFDQSILDVNLIVSDVLYAGFSSKYIGTFMPDFGLLKETEMISETTAVSKTIDSKPFFIFCLASTKCGVKLELGFAPPYGNSPPAASNGETGKMGWLISRTDQSVKIPCELLGAPEGIVTVKNAVTGENPTQDEITVSWSYPEPSSNKIMMIRVQKDAIPSDSSDIFETKLQLKLSVI